MIEKPKVAHFFPFFLDLLVISSELVVNLKICQYESCRAGNLAQKRHLTLSGSSIMNKQNEFENIISLFAFVVVAILLSKHALVRSYSSQCETAALALCGRGQRRTLPAQFSHVLRLRRSRFFLLRALAPQNFPSAGSAQRVLFSGKDHCLSQRELTSTFSLLFSGGLRQMVPQT